METTRARNSLSRIWRFVRFGLGHLTDGLVALGLANGGGVELAVWLHQQRVAKRAEEEAHQAEAVRARAVHRLPGPTAHPSSSPFTSRSLAGER